MKRLLVFGLVFFLGLGAWRLASSLSSDALGMAVGMVFGVLAGIPTALLVLATGRQLAERGEEEALSAGRSRQTPAYPFQPPVIVVTGQSGQPPQQPARLQGDSPYFVASRSRCLGRHAARAAVPDGGRKGRVDSVDISSQKSA